MVVRRGGWGWGPDGEDLVVLNPFHPQQVVHITAAGGAITLPECWSDRPLPEIRRTLVGATDRWRPKPAR